MATPRQIASNRRNALRSTGPKSLEGKRAASRNALKHGILARDTFLFGEDPKVYDAMVERLHAELRPAGELEVRIVERIADAFWRLKRVVRFESSLVRYHYFLALDAKASTASYESHDPDEEGNIKVTDPELADWAEKTGAEATAELESEATLLGRAFNAALGEHDFEHLLRYETALDRSLLKWIHELQRLQAARGLSSVAPPQALDISIDTGESGSFRRIAK